MGEVTGKVDGGCWGYGSCREYFYYIGRMEICAVG